MDSGAAMLSLHLMCSSPRKLLIQGILSRSIEEEPLDEAWLHDAIKEGRSGEMF